MAATRRHFVGLAAGLAASGWAAEALAADTLAAGTPAADTPAAGQPVLADHPMVARIWHGRTPADKADEYRRYLFEAGVKKIATLPGNRGVQMMMSKTATEGEFMVVSYWDSVDAIKGYAGADYTKVHDLPRDKDFLIDHEPLVRHFELAVNFWQS